MVPGVALGIPGLAVLRGDGGPELGDLVHGNGERVVLPSARVLEIVVDGGRPVLPGAPVGRDRALDGGRERGDLGEDFGAGTALFRWFLFYNICVCENQAGNVGWLHKYLGAPFA